MERISKDEYYLNIADAVSERSTCLRYKYGSVIVNNDEIKSTGYNGSPRGEVNCCDIGYCYRIANKIPSGTQYELCRSCHGEANAIISASRQEMIGAFLYIGGKDSEGNLVNNCPPCDMCRRLIQNAGIKEVIMRDIDGNPIHILSEDLKEYSYFELKLNNKIDAER